MLRGHVFIVSESTLPVHLGYMFVGTNAGDRDRYISLLGDMLRVKEGDLVFFYIEATPNQKGRFFGIFRAAENAVYHLEGDNALEPSLPKKLIYRRKILPQKVYPLGVLEWIALDKLPTYSRELLWSLIYRKMKGRRGNTMLLPWEVERLISLIEDANNGAPLTSQHYTFDSHNCTIQPGMRTDNHDIGQTIDVPLRDIKKSETAFQAYILQNLTNENNSFLPDIFGRNIIWIGNEVFAGSGMQKIDIMIIEKTDETSYIYRIIELKHPKSTGNINFAPEQLRYYVEWAREDCGGHILGGKKFNIKPMLLVLTQNFNYISPNLVNSINQLSSIAKDPEVWEINFSFETNKLWQEA